MNYQHYSEENREDEIDTNPYLHLLTFLFLSSNLGFPPVLQTRLYVGATSTTCRMIVFVLSIYYYCPTVSLVDCNCFHISIFGILAKCQWSANDTDVVIPLWESGAFHSWTWLSSWNARESKKLNPWVRSAMFIFDLCLDIFS